MNKKELEQLYDISIKSYDELLHIQKQHIEENERLNNELQDFKVQDISNQEKLYNLIEENERLNNIINELEKWLEYSINEHTNVIKSNNDIYWEIIHKEKYESSILTMSLVLDKLKELKEK